MTLDRRQRPAVFERPEHSAVRPWGDSSPVSASSSQASSLRRIFSRISCETRPEEATGFISIRRYFFFKTASQGPSPTNFFALGS